MITEINPIKFLDTHLHNKDGIYVTYVYRKQTKIRAHWSSQIPKKYKRNSVNVDLWDAKNISSNFQEQIKFITNKFIKADFPLLFINKERKRKRTAKENVQKERKKTYSKTTKKSYLSLRISLKLSSRF